MAKEAVFIEYTENLRGLSVQLSSVTQSHPTFCNLIDYSPPGSSVHGFPRQEYWGGLPFPSPRDLPAPEIELGSPALKAEPPEKPQLTQTEQ